MRVACRAIASPWPTSPPTPAERAAFADAEPRAYWMDASRPQDAQPALVGAAEADLCIVGGGFTGLWAALYAKATDPARDVVLLEAETAGFGASGRNGGFAMASLTHGLSNGLARFADEMQTLERLALENFAGMKADLARHGIDCDWVENGDLTVAVAPHEEAWLEPQAELLRRFGHDADVLDAAATRAEVDSPTYRGAVWDRTGAATLDPGKLAAGLRGAAVRAGVRVHEHTRATGLERDAAGVTVLAPQGRVRARRVLLATSAFPPLLRLIRRYVAPVYDYALMTEPLGRDRLAAIGWERRQGIGDMGNQFHYYRRTADDRILFGGYDAVYRFGGPVGPRLDTDDATFGRLSQHFFHTLPQLEGLRFTHRWGGAIDTCSRFSVFFGTAHGGRVAYAVGYTGLGVVATRFGAQVALDLLDGRRTEATALRYVRRKPVPFPPEPLRSAVIGVTRNRLAAADRAEGRRGLWLRTLDRLGLGFDS
jgi:glycine/D-amino acid oxidase-like deaminating enzyme